MRARWIVVALLPFGAAIGCSSSPGVSTANTDAGQLADGSVVDSTSGGDAGLDAQMGMDGGASDTGSSTDASDASDSGAVDSAPVDAAGDALQDTAPPLDAPAMDGASAVDAQEDSVADAPVDVVVDSMVPAPCMPRPGDSACTACTKNECCSQLVACESDANCLCFASCQAQGQSALQCEAMCGQPDQSTTQLGQCEAMSCSGSCP
jgi:hypothetical protein